MYGDDAFMGCCPAYASWSSLCHHCLNRNVSKHRVLVKVPTVAWQVQMWLRHWRGDAIGSAWLFYSPAFSLTGTSVCVILVHLLKHPTSHFLPQASQDNPAMVSWPSLVPQGPASPFLPCWNEKITTVLRSLPGYCSHSLAPNPSLGTATGRKLASVCCGPE